MSKGEEMASRELHDGSVVDAGPLPRAIGEPWRIMTIDEYLASPIQGRHLIQLDYDGFGGVAVWLTGDGAERVQLGASEAQHRDALNPLPSGEDTAKLAEALESVLDGVTASGADKLVFVLPDGGYQRIEATCDQAAAHLTTQSAEIARWRKKYLDASRGEAEAAAEIARLTARLAEVERERASWEARAEKAWAGMDAEINRNWPTALDLAEAEAQLAAARARAERVKAAAIMAVTNETQACQKRVSDAIRQALQQQDGSDGR